MEITPREAILKKLRQAVIEKIRNPYPDLDLDSPVLGSSRDSNYTAFAEQVVLQNATFTYCEHIFSMLDHLVSMMEKNRWRRLYAADNQVKNQLQEIGVDLSGFDEQIPLADAVVAWAESGVYSTGTLVFTNKQTDLRLLAKIPIWIVLVDVKNIAQDLREVFTRLKANYGRDLPSQILLSSGLGQTYELEFMEHTGSFIPEQLFVMLVEGDTHLIG